MRAVYLPAIVIAALAMGGASSASRLLTVCSLIAAPDRYLGQTIAVEGYVIVGNHGVHMLEPGCDYEINLVDSGRDFRGARSFHRVVRRLESGPVMVKLRATGTFSDSEPSEGRPLEDNLLSMLGPYLELTEVQIVTVQSLSRLEWRRYQDWLDDPGSDQFRPSPR